MTAQELKQAIEIAVMAGQVKAEVESIIAERDRLRSDLAAISKALAILNMDGEPVELAELAGKVIPILADKAPCEHVVCPNEALDCDDCAIKTAVEAAKGGSGE